MYVIRYFCQILHKLVTKRFMAVLSTGGVPNNNNLSAQLAFHLLYCHSYENVYYPVLITYLTGYYNNALVSITTYIAPLIPPIVQCFNFFQEWWDLQFLDDSERKIFEKIFIIFRVVVYFVLFEVWTEVWTMG